MSSLVFTDGYVSLGGTEISSYIKSATLSHETAALDDTTFGDDTTSNKPGLHNWSLSIEPLSDFADNLLDEILWNLKGTSFAIEMRPVNTTVSANNPKYTAYGMITSHQLMGGSVGELSMSPIQIVPSKGSNSATLTRATS